MSGVQASPALPLAGKRVLVTRTAQQASRLSDGLRTLGAEPVEVPVIEIRPPDSFEALDRAIGELKDFDWLILTSTNAVQAVAGRCLLLGVDVSELESLRVAAVGAATAEAAREAGFRVAVVPEQYNSEGLAVALADAVRGRRVLLARARIARDVIPEALIAAGAAMTVVDAYRNALPEGAGERLAEAIGDGLDAAAFTSSSSVRHLAMAARDAGIVFPLEGVAAISIGPVTSATLREYGWPPEVEAAVADIAGLIEAVRKGIAS